LSRIESEARDQSMQVTQALAARLFPALSQRFLAAEIAQHLPQLIPASVPSIEIRARQEMLSKLEPLIARDPSLSERCKMTPAVSEDEPRVLVSWQTGGVTFDFEGLSGCVPRPSGPLPHNDRGVDSWPSLWKPNPKPA
jgi:hypothetical protein